RHPRPGLSARPRALPAAVRGSLHRRRLRRERSLDLVLPGGPALLARALLRRALVPVLSPAPRARFAEVARRVCGGDRRGLLSPLRLRLRGGRPGRAPARGARPLVALGARVAVDAGRAGAPLPSRGAAARAPLRAAWGPGLGAAGDVVRPSPSLRRLSRPPAPHRARRGRCPDRARPRAAP